MSEKISVLVIEDHRMFADALRLLLEGEDDLETTGVVGTAEEGLDLCRQRCPDVALMDCDLPGMDGIEGTQRILEVCPEVHVVVITALQPTDVLDRAVEAGAAGFVPKTEAADHLLDVVRRAALGEIVLPPRDTARFLMKLRDARRAQGNLDRLLSQLTKRELEILRGIATGKTTRELAQMLFISAHTVQSHTRSILTKLGVRSKLEAVLMALRTGIIGLETDQPNRAS